MTERNPLLLLDKAEEAAARLDFASAALIYEQASQAYDVAASATTDPSAARTLKVLAEKALQHSRESQARAVTAQNKAQKQRAVQQADRHGQLVPKQRRNIDPVHALEASRRQLAVQPARRTAFEPTYPASNAAFVASASMMESRVTKRSNSPSGGRSPAASIFPEGSYMVLKDDMNSSDAFTRFNAGLEKLVGDISNPVAFASLPLAVARKPTTKKATSASRPFNGDVDGSYLLVSSASDMEGNQSGKSIKTHEELLFENAQLKETLDELAQQYQQTVDERKKERESLKHSILDMRQNWQKAASNRRDGAMSMISGPGTASLAHLPVSSQSRVADLEKEVDSLKQELQSSRLSAAKYKARYDQLRDAIKKKKEKSIKEESAAKVDPP